MNRLINHCVTRTWKGVSLAGREKTRPRELGSSLNTAAQSETALNPESQEDVSYVHYPPDLLHVSKIPVYLLTPPLWRMRSSALPSFKSVA